MKKLALFLLLVVLAGLVKGQTIRSNNYGTIAKISSDGTIKNGSYVTIGYIRDGKVQNSAHVTIGYVGSDGKVQDAGHSTVGYVKEDGKVVSSSYTTLGYIRKDGKVVNASYTTLGYAGSVPKEWAALIFFFFHFE
ncbi:5-fold beta-flower protein [Chitinophaga arvensicola]|uniref:Uncharacterized protein n=1 Tax=Chitinophaga arvensicola TaxID=29529 RepID=A0A1I0QX32_9BACT|nr:hypothetical protein [Chitinophaga arvensicola]SEW32072.1 hypothetical protein SAMN04488122_1830 [Chitinophaga arvensicola]